MQETLSKIQSQIDDLTRKKGVVETEEITSRRASEETSEKIRNHRSQIEKNILSFMNRPVKVE